MADEEEQEGLIDSSWETEHDLLRDDGGREDEEKLQTSMMQGISGPSIRGVHFLMIVAAMMILESLNMVFFRLNGCSTSTMQPSSSSWPSGKEQQPEVFGFVHMAKTAGSEINGELASHFERVCGNKGYSHDYYQFNRRFQNWAPQHPNTSSPLGPPGDIVNDKYRGASRGKIGKWDLMLEEGLQDCDWIGIEQPFNRWNVIAAMNLGRTQPIELHVPCRDPISHLMSMCNVIGRSFDCSTQNLAAEVKKCVIFQNRFSRTAFQKNTNLSLRCFNPIPIEGYLDYMSSRLQRKRVENVYFHRPSNKPRNKTKECIWNDKDLQRKVKEIMLRQYDYYAFCSECLGSSEDLLINSSPIN